MGSNRRGFLKSTVALSAASILPTNLVKNDNLIQCNFPFVVSTWDNKKANDAAYQSFENSADVLDAVVAGIKIPEGDEHDRSVGYGGRPDRSGNVTLDACIMDAKGRAGSVCYVQRFRHPIEIARRVMDKTPHVMLVGDGAERFARAEGFVEENLLTPKSEAEYKEWLKTSKYEPIINIERHDTIGLLAADKKGVLGGGCSTSGMAYKMEGRVGDSPIIGAALYVDDHVGACTCTGHGEYVLRTLASFLVVEFMRQGKNPFKACQLAIERIVKHHVGFDQNYQVGLIATNKKGQIGAFSFKPGFVYCVTTNGKTVTYTSKSYEK